MNDLDLKFLLLDKFSFIEELSLNIGFDGESQKGDAVTMTRILTLVKGREFSISELARKLNLSRQAVHKQIKKMEEEGIIRLISPLDNKKVKNVVLTERGQELIRKRGKTMAAVENKIAEKIGKDRLSFLKEILNEQW